MKSRTCFPRRVLSYRRIFFMLMITSILFMGKLYFHFKLNTGFRTSANLPHDEHNLRNDDETPIPNIVHYVLDYRLHEFSFQFYLSVMGVVKFVQPKKIIFHYVARPYKTIWWAAATRYVGPRLEVRLIQNEELIDFSTLNFKRDVDRDNYILKVLLEEGGIIMDPNMVAVKSLDVLREHHIVFKGVYHNTGRNHILMAAPNATFLTSSLSSIPRPPSVQIIPLNNFSKSIQNGQIPPSEAVSWNSTYLIQTNPWLSTLGKNLMLGSPARGLVELVLYNTVTNNGRIPSKYHYIWYASEPRDLSFIEHQSVKSLFFNVEPENIILHGNIEPSGKRWNDVISIKQVVFIRHNQIDMNNITDLKYHVLKENGGILLQFGVMFINSCEPLRGTHIVQSANKGFSTNSVIMVPPKQIKLDQLLMTQTAFHSMIKESFKHIVLEDECILTFRTLEEASRTVVCENWNRSIWVKIDDVNNILTDEAVVMSMDSSVGEILRYVLYGVSHVIKKSSFKVPNLVHYVWLGKTRPLGFMNFLSIFSVHSVQKPDKIYFHYETLPTGAWWEKIQKVVPNITLLKTKSNSTLGGKTVKWVEHKTDHVRIRTLQKYGGIYVDTDVIVINSLDALRVYDYVQAIESPGALGSSFILCKPNYSFLKLWEKGYITNYKSTDWAFNAVVYPYHLLVRDKGPVWLAPTRKVFIPIYSNIGELYDSNRRFYWKDNYIIHLWAKTGLPKDMPHEEAIYSPKYYNTTFGEMSRRLYGEYKQKYSSAHNSTE